MTIPVFEKPCLERPFLRRVFFNLFSGCGVLTLIALWLVMAAPSVKAAPKVLTTIKPLQLIVHELSDGVLQPSRLLPDGFTPHDYHLKPRDRLALEEANLVVWLGPTTEPYLRGLMKQLANKAGTSVVNVSAIEGLTVLPSRSISHHHEGHGHHSEGHREGHGLEDGHLWLSPKNTQVMAQHLANQLMALVPAQRGRIEQNLQAFTAKLEGLSWLHTAGVPKFLVYHDAFQYLEAFVQVYAREIIVSDAQETPGIRHIIEVQKTVQEEGIDCVIVGPVYNPGLLDKLFGSQAYRTVFIDPLASAEQPGKDSYVDFLQRAANQLYACGSTQGVSEGLTH